MISPGFGDLGFLIGAKLVPNGLIENLLSISQTCKAGWVVTFTDNSWNMKHKKNGRQVNGFIRNGLYYLKYSDLFEQDFQLFIEHLDDQALLVDSNHQTQLCFGTIASSTRQWIESKGVFDFKLCPSI